MSHPVNDAYYDALADRVNYVLEEYTSTTAGKMLASMINQPSPNYDAIEKLVTELEGQLSIEHFNNYDLLPKNEEMPDVF